jgi:hypothetical protein
MFPERIVGIFKTTAILKRINFTMEVIIKVLIFHSLSRIFFTLPICVSLNEEELLEWLPVSF